MSCSGPPIIRGHVGVRHDNRPENLELWTRPQPAGIRVSDAVAWAHQILDRYKGHCGTSNNAHGLPWALLEVAGIEPASFSTSPGLLRAQPALAFLSPGVHAGESPTGSATA